MPKSSLSSRRSRLRRSRGAAWNPHRELAAAVVEQACKDYNKSLKKELTGEARKLRDWLVDPDNWAPRVLNIDPEMYRSIIDRIDAAHAAGQDYQNYHPKGD